MKPFALIVALVGSGVAGYFTHAYTHTGNYFDQFDPPAGPYELRVVGNHLVKFHPKSGRMWALLPADATSQTPYWAEKP
jgi:hypothetical protein